MSDERRETAAAWDRMERAFDELSHKESQFFRGLRSGSMPLDEVIAVVGEAFEARGSWAAMHYLDKLGPEVVRALLPGLVRDASYASGRTGRIRQIIWSLPCEELVQSVGPMAKALLSVDGTEETYRCMLELCNGIDPALTEEVAAMARAHADPEICELGVEWAS